MSTYTAPTYAKGESLIQLGGGVDLYINEVIDCPCGTIYQCNRGYLYIPDIITDNTTIHQYMHGDSPDGGSIVDFLKGSNDVNGIYFINGIVGAADENGNPYNINECNFSPYSQTPNRYFTEKMNDLKSTIEQGISNSNNGTEVSLGTVTEGFSASTKWAAKEAIYQGSKYAFMIDDNRQFNDNVVFTDAERQYLAENNIPIVTVEGSHQLHKHIEKIIKEDNITVIEIDPLDGNGNNPQHMETRDWVYKSGLPEFLNGERSDIKNVDGYEYTIKKAYYDNETGEIVKKEITKEEALEIIKAPKSSSFEENNKEKFTEEDKISVDYKFVITYANNIIEAINNTKITKMDNITSQNPSSLTFNNAANAFNNYKNNSINFLNNLDTVSKNIISIAESMKKLDNSMAYSIGGQIDSSQLSQFYDIFNSKIEFPDYTNCVQDGKLKITKSEILQSMSQDNQIIKSLLEDISDTNKIKASLDVFISDSSEMLEGDAWNVVREKIAEYNTVLDKKNDYANNLISGITEGYKKLLEYLDDYDELDTSKKEEYESARDELIKEKNQLIEIKNSIPEKSSYTYCDGDGKCYTEEIDNSATIAAYAAQIEFLEQVIAEMNRLIDKINNLPSVDQESSDVIKESDKSDDLQTEEEKPLGDISSGGSNGGMSSIIDNQEIDNSNEEVEKQNNVPPTNSNAEVKNQNNTSPSNSNGESGQADIINSNNDNEEYFPIFSELKSDDTKNVYLVNESCKIVVQHDNEKILGLEYYYNFDNNDIAEQKLPEIKEYFGNFQSVDKILINNNNIKVKFSNDYCKDYDLNYLNDYYSNYQKI